jgi:hypothetical protein
MMHHTSLLPTCLRHGSWLLFCALIFSLTQTSCHSFHITPVYQLSGDLDQNYEKEANYENEFDPAYVTSTHNEKGDFYPVTWVVTAQRVSGPFWEHVEQFQTDKGVKAMHAKLARLVQKNGFSLLMASNDARRVLGNEAFTQFLRSAANTRQTKLFQYIYFGPGITLVQDGSNFAPGMP